MFDLLKKLATAIGTPDTGRSRLFIDSTDKALKLRDESGVLLSPGRYGGAAISPAQLVANTDNWAPTDYATCGRIRFSTDASRDITGIVALSDSVRITLINIGAQNAVLKHDATSTAANRFYCPGAADFTLNAGDSAVVEYDAVSSRWRVLGF